MKIFLCVVLLFVFFLVVASGIAGSAFALALYVAVGLPVR